MAILDEIQVRGKPSMQPSNDLSLDLDSVLPPIGELWRWATDYEILVHVDINGSYQYRALSDYLPTSSCSQTSNIPKLKVPCRKLWNLQARNLIFPMTDLFGWL